MHQAIINNQTHPLSQPILVGVCDTFFLRLLGFMFHSPISIDQGLIINQNNESKIDSAIHMFFVNFDLAIIWIDQLNKVVDTCLARRWHPFYMPNKRAKLILEIHPDHLDQFGIGDQLSIENVKMD